jgi:hypothetical protein
MKNIRQCKIGSTYGCSCAQDDYSFYPHVTIMGDANARPRGVTGMDWVYYITSSITAVGDCKRLEQPDCIRIRCDGEHTAIELSQRLFARRPELVEEALERAAAIPGVTIHSEPEIGAIL